MGISSLFFFCFCGFHCLVGFSLVGLVLRNQSSRRGRARADTDLQLDLQLSLNLHLLIVVELIGLVSQVLLLNLYNILQIPLARPLAVEGQAEAELTGDIPRAVIDSALGL